MPDPAPGSLRWRSAAKIAFREARSSAPKFAFVVLAVAVGVGVLTGVRGFSESFRGVMLREARTLMAADLLVRAFDEPSPKQTATLDKLVRQGIRLTRITETVSMMSSQAAPTPILVSVKAVDPKVYPFYGEVKLEPPARLADILTADTVAVSPDLILRLEVRPGDSIRLGSAQFRIAGVVQLEPDRMTGSLNVGPRIMITRGGLDRAQLMQVGSRASRRFLFRLPPGGPSVAEVRETLEETFPGTLISDFREVHPRIRGGLDRATTFLSLVSLIAMIIGALGVAMAMHAHIEQRLDTIAIMKCLGGRSSQIIRIYMIQTLLLGLAGGLLGVLFGMGVQAAFPSLIERYFQLRPDTVYDFATAVQGVAVGLLATLLFTLPPLVRIREVRPAVIFRREMPEARRSLRERLRRGRSSLGVTLLIVLGVGAIAAWLSNGDGWADSVVTSLYFLGSLIVSLTVLSAIAWLLLRGLRALLRRSGFALPVLLRHGIANLYRPGNHAQAVLVALGVGVMFTLSVYLLQHGLLSEILRAAPRDMPNVFLINITAEERAPLARLLARQQGVVSPPEIFASARARITAIDSTPVGQIELPEWASRYRRERSVTWRDEQPANITVEDGRWWNPAEENGAPRVCMATHIAEALGVEPGARIDWVAGGLPIRTTLACTHEVEEIRFGPSLEFIFSPGALAGLPVMYFGGVRVEPEHVAALQRASFRAFPTVTVINAAEVLAIVQEVVDQVAVVVRFVALFAILAGVVILASSVAGTRFRRIREAAILKTLGATRRRVMTVFSIEFLILGTVAGAMGSLLASGFSALLLNQMLDAPYRFDPLPNLAAIALTALIAMGAGWLASFRILGQKPLEVLRNE